MKKIGKLASIAMILALGAVSVASCSKDDITITVGNEPGGNGSGDGTGNNCGNDTTKVRAKLFFDANLYDLLTKAAALSPLADGRYVTVYAYDGSAMTTSVMYKSDTPGTLTPTGSTPLELATGTYNLYAPGVNSPASTAVPVFSGTTYTGLQNNIDYIWWGKTGLVVEGSSQNLTMNLEHCCAQVVIQLIDSAAAVTGTPVSSITPSLISNNVWTLPTGVISNSTSVSTEFMSMPTTASGTNGITSYYSQLTMMPLLSTQNMTVKFTATVSGSSRNYEVSLPVYKGNLQAGYSYKYQLVLKNNEITFNNTVNVINWIAVDATSAPIIPSQL